MEDTQVIHVLNISLLESKRRTVLFSQKVQRIERLCLRFGDRWNIGRPRLCHEPGKVAAGVLDQDSLRCVRCSGLVVEERTGAVWLRGVGESILQLASLILCKKAW